MINNNYDKYPYFKVDINLYPSREQQLKFIRAYLNEYLKIKPNEFKSSSIDELEEKLLIEANYFSLASGFLWTLWAMVKAPVMKNNFAYLVSL